MCQNVAPTAPSVRNSTSNYHRTFFLTYFEMFRKYHLHGRVFCGLFKMSPPYLYFLSPFLDLLLPPALNTYNEICNFILFICYPSTQMKAPQWYRFLAAFLLIISTLNTTLHIIEIYTNMLSECY